MAKRNNGVTIIITIHISVDSSQFTQEFLFAHGNYRFRRIINPLS